MTPLDLTWSFPDRYFYLASPYSRWWGGLDDACNVVAEIAGRLIQRGLPVFSPIAHSHTISRAAHMDPMLHEVWLPVDKPLAISAAGLIVVDIDGWRDSVGIREELRWFREWVKPCLLIDPVELEMREVPRDLG